jgi:ATP-binding cassette subfamily B protein RaxB
VSAGSLPLPDLLLQFSVAPQLPMVRQSQVTECGLACLTMVAAYHGFTTDLSSMRQRLQPSAQGTNLKQLIDHAGQLKLNARALRLEPSQLTELNLPCVLHWDLSHFVVLKSVGKKFAVIHNPASGVRQLPIAELAEHFTGIALELTPAEDFVQEKSQQRLKLSSLWSRIHGLRACLAQIFFLSILLQLYALAAPFYVQTVVDDVILRNDSGLLAALATGFGLLLIIETGTSALRSFVILHLASRLHLQLAANLFRHLIHLPLDFFQKRHMGDVLSRFSSLDAIKQILCTGLVATLVDGLLAMATLLAMFIYDRHLTMVVLSILSAYAVLRVILYRPIRQLTEESLISIAHCESSFLESLRSIQTIKLFQRESQRQGHWQNRLVESMNKNIKLTRLEITHDSASIFLFGLENILVVYLAAELVMQNVMTVGMFFAFMSYKHRFVTAMDSLINQLIAIKMLGVHLERIADITFTQTEPAREGDATGSTEEISIRASGLGYRYSASEAWVFSDLNFRIASGEFVALVGPSGCGKSTLLKCLLGLLPPTAGQLHLSGNQRLNSSGFRSQVAAVMQDDHLLSGTIAENIACFDHELDWKKMTRSAELACIHEDVAMMPMQYSTPIGDMGSALSGGQVQRIMLARAFYREPKILFLDEATSHLDIATEQRINQNLSAMKITRIVVAHRPETIAMADRLIELRPESREPVSRMDA